MFLRLSLGALECFRNLKNLPSGVQSVFYCCETHEDNMY